MIHSDVVPPIDGSLCWGQVLDIYDRFEMLVTYPTVNSINSSSTIWVKILKTSFLSEHPIIVHIKPSVCHVGYPMKMSFYITFYGSNRPFFWIYSFNLVWTDFVRVWTSSLMKMWVNAPCIRIYHYGWRCEHEDSRYLARKVLDRLLRYKYFGTKAHSPLRYVTNISTDRNLEISAISFLHFQFHSMQCWLLVIS